MASTTRLRRLRTGTVINLTSKKQEEQIGAALIEVDRRLCEKYPYRFTHEKRLPLRTAVAHLSESFPEVDFHVHFDTSSINPDGGFLYLVGTDEQSHLVLVSEVKNQGTNDRRLAEGKSKQAKGNAIERLGKNVIGLRTAMLTETIFPFVCFGYGCDFEPDSSILDRVSTIAMFGRLNAIHLHRQGPGGEFDRGSFYFRAKRWTVEEMADVMFDVANRSVLYYQSKYGEDNFVRRDSTELGD